MLDFFPFPLLAGLGILAVLLVILHRRRSQAYLFCFSMFYVYLLLVVSITVFPLPLQGELEYRSSAAYILSKSNLVPFNFGELFDFSPAIIYEQIFGNILLTLPFGFGIPFVVKFNPKNILWWAVGAGLAIEAAQLGISLWIGGVYRSVDINDVLLNATGTLLGYGLFRGFTWLYVTIVNRVQTRQSGLFAYFYEVAIYAVNGQD